MMFYHFFPPPPALQFIPEEAETIFRVDVLEIFFRDWLMSCQLTWTGRSFMTQQPLIKAAIQVLQSLCGGAAPSVLSLESAEGSQVAPSVTETV